MSVGQKSDHGAADVHSSVAIRPNCTTCVLGAMLESLARLLSAWFTLLFDESANCASHSGRNAGSEETSSESGANCWAPGIGSCQPESGVSFEIPSTTEIPMRVPQRGLVGRRSA